MVMYLQSLPQIRTWVTWNYELEIKFECKAIREEESLPKLFAKMALEIGN